MHNGPVTRLVLWDIDGTLVDAAGFGWRVAQQAYLQVCGSPLTTTVVLAGRTDRAIYLDALAVNGRDDSDLAALCHAIGVVAAANQADLRAGGGRALPGAVEAIAALAAQPGVVQSVLTGNIRSLGVVKLDAVGLLDPLDLAVAAFGDDHIARADLVTVARELFSARNGSGPPPDIVLIGDTPLDVAAARESGAGMVAVATGDFTAGELTEAGAPVVLPDLTDLDRLVDAVLSASRTSCGGRTAGLHDAGRRTVDRDDQCRRVRAHRPALAGRGGQHARRAQPAARRLRPRRGGAVRRPSPRP